MRKTKIICTLGPNCRDIGTLEKMLAGGMDAARLNFSHQNHSFHRENIETIKELRRRTGKPLALILDTKGPEIRTGLLEGGAAELKAGEKTVLSAAAGEGNARLIGISFPSLADTLNPGDIILIDDGKIKLAVDKISGGEISCEILRGGILGNTRGVNLPGIDTDIPFLSERDRADLLLGIEQGVDYVAASFVRSAEDVRQMRRFLCDNGGGDIRIISKIESRSAVKRFEDILKESDGIMVARGDLGVEVPFERLPGLQKKMISLCYKSGKMAVTATQMLESMISGGDPTRAEISDVANAVFDMTSAVMLSGETAIGKDPAAVVEAMARICSRAQEDCGSFCTACRREQPEPLCDATDAVCAAAVTAAESINAAAIIAVTANGRTARLAAKYRPSIPIIAAAFSERVFNQLAANWGVIPLLTEPEQNPARAFERAAETAERLGFIRSGDRLVLVCGASPSSPGHNMLRIV